MENPTLEQLRQAYSKITDTRLKSLIEDRDKLSLEAKQVFDEELKRRKIDITDYLESQKNVALKKMGLEEGDMNMGNDEIQELLSDTSKIIVNNENTLDEITNTLVSKGIETEKAKTIAQNLYTQVTDDIKAKQIIAEKDMRTGARWFWGGVIITSITYLFAEDLGGSYIVTWGAIVFGAIQFFRGLSNSNKPFKIFD